MERFDFIVIGAGIAGASVAAELASDHAVLLVEAEAQPGYHSTGRSAALYSELYGPPPVRALTRASRDFFFDPPSGFSDDPLVLPRGTLFIETHAQAGALDKYVSGQDDAALSVRIDGQQACAMCPVLKQGTVIGAIHEPGACDIDVHALHQGYLRQFRKLGGQLLLSATTDAIVRDNGNWIITTQNTTASAPVLINAAGAWADEVAVMAGAAPIGLSAMRRTAIIVDPPEGKSIADWPMVIDVDEQFYFKPDAGKILMSPADETLSAPCDAQAEEWDIAVAIDRVMAVADIPVRRVPHSWAGLRTFTPDRIPAVGFDDVAEGFFWLAGQGGYGVQTAPALSRFAALLASSAETPCTVLDGGINTSTFCPSRFRPTLRGIGGLNGSN